MRNIDQYTYLYSGTEVKAILLKGLLEEAGISSILQDDFYSGNMGGFVGGTPTTVRLKVKVADFEKSRSIVEEFEQENNKYDEKEN